MRGNPRQAYGRAYGSSDAGPKVIEACAGHVQSAPDTRSSHCGRCGLDRYRLPKRKAACPRSDDRFDFAFSIRQDAQAAAAELLQIPNRACPR